MAVHVSSDRLPIWRTRWRSSVLTHLALLTLAGALLRFFKLTSQSVWNDEAYSVALANNPVSSIVTSVIGDHVPLYFLVLKGWMTLFGPSEFGIRSLSVLFGIAAIPVAYVVAKRLFGRSIGTITALLVVFSPLLVYYSQETRMYSLLTFQGLLLTYALLIGLDGRRVGWLIYAIVGATVLYTHYYGLILIASQAVFMAAWLLMQRNDPRSRRTLIDCIMVGVFLAIAFLPWVWQRATVFNTFISAASQTIDLGSIVWQSLVAFGLGHSIVGVDAPNTNAIYVHDFTVASWMTFGFVIIAIVGVFGAWATPHSVYRNVSPAPRGWLEEHRSLLVVLTVLIGSLLLIFLVSIGKRGFAPRYVTMLTPYYLMLLASGLSYAWAHARYLFYAGAALVAFCTLLALNNYYFDGKYARGDFRSAAAYIQANSVPNQIVISNAGYAIDVWDYYLRGSSPTMRLPAAVPLDPVETDRALREIVNERDYIWLALWQDYYSDPQKYVEHWLDTNAIMMTEHIVHGNIRVRGYRTRPPTIDPASVPNPRFDPMGNKLALVGYQLAPLVAGQQWSVTLYLRTLARMDKDYTFFLHLVIPGAERWAQRDAQPYDGHYPTSRWEEGQTVMVEYLLDIPGDSPITDYRLEFGAYELTTMEHLSTQTGNRLEIATIRMGPASNSAR